MDTQYRITIANHIKQHLWKDVRSYNWTDLCSVMTNHELGQKDGSCFTPAVFSGEKRRKSDAQQIDLLAFDCDDGTSLEHIISNLSTAGLKGIIYSTHSHMRSEQSPIAKFRVIVPLKTPWRADDFDSQTQANNAWSRAIFDISNSLKLQHDQSCKDTSRAYFFPRHDVGKEYVTKITEGNPYDIDWNTYKNFSPPPPKPIYSSLNPYVQKALNDQIAMLSQAQEGERNHCLNKAAFSLGKLVRKGLPAEVITQYLTPVALKIGLGQQETSKTIQSALLSGMQQSLEEVGYRLNEIDAHIARPIPVSIPMPSTTLPPPPAPLPPPHVAAISTPTSEIDLVCMDDVEMSEIEWLWEDRIALGKLTVFAGQPGLGKSQILAMICAHVTSGTLFPDGTAPYDGDVVLLSAEDDMADTIKPRLMAAGANLSRCHCINDVKTIINGTDHRKMFDLKSDIQALERTIKANPAIRLITIDPVSAYQGQTDSHGNAEMRSLLAPYAKLAADYNIAIVLVTHFNKSNSQEPIERVIGSIGLIAAARAGFAVIKDPEDDTKRYFVPIKNNIGNDRDGFAYNIQGEIIDDKYKTSRIQWHPGIVQASKVLKPDAERKSTQESMSAEFLQELLSDGPMLVKDVFENGTGAGFNKSSLHRARGRLKVNTRKLGFTERWVWFLPHHEHLFIEMLKSSQSSKPS